MTFRWVWDGGGESPGFPTREDAEAWLSGEWQQLLAAGVSEVVLKDPDEAVYEMKLTPE